MPPHSNFTKHDPGLCACGCETPVDNDGLAPRFADGACRRRWTEQWAIGPGKAERVVLDDGSQDPPPPAVPVAAEEAVQVRAEFAQRITVAPQADAVIGSAPSGMWVQPQSRSLWKALTSAVRKVW